MLHLSRNQRAVRAQAKHRSTALRKKRNRARLSFDSLETRTLLSVTAVSTSDPTLHAFGGIGTFSQNGRVISDDGRYAVYNSGDNVVTNDHNYMTDVFVRDLQTGAATLVSANPSGQSGNNDSGGGFITPNGRYVVFYSDATDLVPGTNNGVMNIFVRDLQTGTTQMVDVSTGGAQANATAIDPVITPDGRYVAFRSTATNLVAGAPANAYNVYLRDLVNHTMTLVSTGLPSSTFVWTALGNITISDNGQYVGFQAAQEFSFATRYLFVRDTVNGTTSTISTGIGGASPNGDSSNMVMAPDGQHYAFVSLATNLVSGDSNGTYDIFEYSLATHTVSLVSATSTNTSANGASGVDTRGSTDSPSISADGRYVAYDSQATNLAGAPGAANHFDVYVRDMTTQNSVRADVDTNGNQAANIVAYRPHLSADGSRVEFLGSGSTLVSPALPPNSGGIFERNLTTNTTVYVNYSTTGGPTSVDEYSVTMSSDGTQVGFGSADNNLTPQDGDNLEDVFVRNLNTNTTAMVSSHDPSLPSLTANSDSQLPPASFHTLPISGDGRYVVFSSMANNIVTNDPNAGYDVFRSDRLTGSVIRVDVSSAGTGGGSGSFGPTPSISADGHLVVFDSLANNLTSLPDGNSGDDIFARDLNTGLTTLVSVNAAGTASANGISSSETMTPDGRYVVWRSNATDMTSDSNANSFYDIFERDLLTGVTKLVTIGTGGFAGNGHSQNASVTPDGRYVVFESQAGNLVGNDTNLNTDVFVRDMVNGVTTLVSVNAAGTASGNGPSQNASITPDGRYVVFQSTATDIVPSPASTPSQIFVRDLVTGHTYLVSAKTSGAPGNNSSQNAVISSDGRYIAFDSNASDLVAGDTNNTTDVFLRDMTTNATTLVSINAAGTAPGAGASTTPVLSPSGLQVAFTTSAPDLVAVDTNGTQSNVAVRDMNAGTTALLDQHPNRFASGNNPIWSASGHQIAFMAFGDDLTPGDFNSRSDIFVWADASPLAKPGSNYIVSQGASIQLDGSASTDIDSPLTTYEWDFNYNGSTFNVSATGAKPTFSAAGITGPTTRNVALRVTDAKGGQNIATTTVTITANAPSLAAIPDQSVPASVHHLVVTLNGSDSDGDPLTFSAQLTTWAYKLDQTLGLTSDGFYSLNWGGRNEKWLQGAGGLQYFILPDGSFYQWSGSGGANGTLLATLNVNYYNDPTLLWNAAPGTVPATASISGNVLTIDSSVGFIGTFAALATVSDGSMTDSKWFTVSVTDHAPVLTSIPNQTLSHTAPSEQITLSATDADGDPLIFRASANTLAWSLRQQYGLFTNGNYSLNWGGLNEKWIQGAGGQQFFILPDGSFYQWSGTGKANGTLLAQLDPSIYADPTLLTNAQNTPPPATVSLSGNVLTVTANAGFVGSFAVSVTVTDSMLTDTKSFIATVTDNAPVLAAVPNQSIPAKQGSLNVTLSATDADNDPITYSAIGTSLGYELDQRLGLFSDGNYSTNWGGLNEKWIRGSGGLQYFILPDGSFYQWSGVGKANGTLMAQLDPSYYNDPTTLTNATIGSVPATVSLSNNVITISINPGYVGTFAIKASASDGILGDTKWFTVTATDNPPVLSSIPDQTIPGSQQTTNITLNATDADNDPLTFSAVATTLAYSLDQRLGLFTDGNYSLNWGGRNEKWINGSGGLQYFILPDGSLYQWSGTGGANGPLIAQLDPSYYNDPTTLTNAVPGSIPVTVSVSGNTLTITNTSNYVGTFAIKVTVSDGALTDSKWFVVTVTG